MKVMLIDDEKLALDELGYMLSQYTDAEIIGTFTDPVEALEQITVRKPDILFVDIEMPVISGLNLAREVSGLSGSTEVVFITAYDRYALNAFDVNALDYVLKPVIRDRLDQTMDKIRHRQRKNVNIGRSLMNKLDNMERLIRQSGEKFAVWDNDGFSLLKASDISYIAVDNGITSVFAGQGRYIGKDGIEAWERKLSGYNFLRCHRGYLVNMDRAEKIVPGENGCCHIVLRNEKANIPVSRSKTKELKSRFGL